MRIAIDTNVLIASLAKPDGHAARVIASWQEGAFDVVSSAATLREAETIIGASWIGRVAAHDTAVGLLDELRRKAVMVDASRIAGLLLRDEGDRRLVEAAVAGQAEYLVTADRELLLQRGYGPTEFLTAGEFCEGVLSAP